MYLKRILKMAFKVVCVNDADRPDGIPTSKWVKKGIVYTVIEVKKLSMQNGMLGFKLAEINIDDCFPYQFFAASRFVPFIPPKNDSIEETLDRILKEAIEEEKKEVQTL